MHVAQLLLLQLAVVINLPRPLIITHGYYVHGRPQEQGAKSCAEWHQKHLADAARITLLCLFVSCTVALFRTGYLVKKLKQESC